MIQKSELRRALLLLNERGYVTEYEAAIGMPNTPLCEIGYDGELNCLGRYFENAGAMYVIYDVNEFEPDQILGILATQVTENPVEKRR